MFIKKPDIRILYIICTRRLYDIRSGRKRNKTFAFISLKLLTHLLAILSMNLRATAQFEFGSGG